MRNKSVISDCPIGSLEYELSEIHKMYQTEEENLKESDSNFSTHGGGGFLTILCC